MRCYQHEGRDAMAAAVEVAADVRDRGRRAAWRAAGGFVALIAALRSACLPASRLGPVEECRGPGGDLWARGATAQADSRRARASASAYSRGSPGRISRRTTVPLDSGVR